MNLPAAMAALAAGALEPAFGAAVDVARQKIAAFAAVLGGIGLRDRGHRAARPGRRILPVLAGILVALAEHVGGGVAGEGEIAVSRRRLLRRAGDRAGEISVVGLGKGTAVTAGEAATAAAQSNENHCRHEA